ncbi:hypothetical protein ANTPLA_LOCUS3616 [Anthophora plagiata]
MRARARVRDPFLDLHACLPPAKLRPKASGKDCTDESQEKQRKKREQIGRGERGKTGGCSLSPEGTVSLYIQRHSSKHEPTCLTTVFSPRRSTSTDVPTLRFLIESSNMLRQFVAFYYTVEMNDQCRSDISIDKPLRRSIFLVSTLVKEKINLRYAFVQARNNSAERYSK